jgi:hypothetical protein
LNRCYTSTPQSSKELKKEWEDKLITTLPECDVKVIEDYYSSLLAKQKEEIIADLKKDPLKLIKLHPQYKDLAKEADERIQIQIDAYNDAKEEFVKELESKIYAVCLSKIPDKFGTRISFGLKNETKFVDVSQEISFETLDIINEALKLLLADIKSKLNKK